MFTMYNTKSTSDTTQKSSEAAETALNNIREIALARKIYNTQLRDFMLSITSIEEFLIFGASIGFTQLMFDMLEPTRVTDLMGSITKGLASTSEEDIHFYSDIINQIDTQSHNQAFIDQLHFLFLGKYEYHKQPDQIMIERNLKLEKEIVKATNTFVESRFYKAILRELELLTSPCEGKFFEEYKIYGIEDPSDGLITRIIDLSGTTKKNGTANKCVLLLKSSLTLIDEAERRFPGKFDLNTVELNKTQIQNTITEIERHLDYLRNFNNTQDTFIKNKPRELWDKHREIHENYQDANESKRRLENYLALLTHEETVTAEREQAAKEAVKKEKKQIQQGQKMAAKSKTPKKNHPVTSHANEQAIARSNTTESDVEEENRPKEEIEAFKAVKSQALMEFKERVTIERAEKDRRRLSITRLEYQELQARQALERQSLVTKEADDRENAFYLLNPLNTNNLELVRKILDTETRQNITYDQIEALFGKPDDGKISGSVTGEGGSHRKISICLPQKEYQPSEEQQQQQQQRQPRPSKQLLGFYDEYSTEDKTVLTNVTGGTFRPHGKAHTGSLPRVAVGMVRDILIRAGINKNNFNLFMETVRNTDTHHVPEASKNIEAQQTARF